MNHSLFSLYANTPLGWKIAAVVSLLLIAGVMFRRLRAAGATKRMGAFLSNTPLGRSLKSLPKYLRKPLIWVLTGAVSVIWLAFAVSLISAYAYVLYLVINAIPPTTNDDAISLRMLLITMTALTASLGAVIALPLTVMRTQYNKRQTDAAEAALVNNKLDAAFAGLSARRTVTSRSREIVYKRFKSEYTAAETPDEPFELPKGATLLRRGPWQVISEEQDDIVTRSTAVDRLEGLAVEQPEQVARIVSILSLYVRELSREYPAHEIPEGMTEVNEIRRWASALSPARPDMEKAAQTLGRLPKLVTGYDPEKTKPDLRSCKLQGFDLLGLSFEHAQIQGAQMKGTNLRGAQMEGANLMGAQMEGANLRRAQMSTVYLMGAQMKGADLMGAQMEGANLRGAQMEGANLMGVRMEGANLTGAQMEGANLTGAQMKGTNLIGAQMMGAILRGAQMEGPKLMGAQMEGANLRGAQMEGANLRGAQMMGADPTDASLRGAFVGSADFTKVVLTPQQWKDILGDPGTILPAGSSYPDHWPKFEIDWADANIQWNRFKANPDAYTPPDPPMGDAET